MYLYKVYSYITSFASEIFSTAKAPQLLSTFYPPSDNFADVQLSLYLSRQQGNLRQALVLTNEWLTIEPYNSRALLNRDYFEAELNRKMAAGAALMGENSTQDDPIVANRKPPDSEFETFLRCCFKLQRF